MYLFRINVTYIFAFFLSVSAVALAALFFVSHYHVIDLSILERYDPGTPSILLDCHGTEWGRFQWDKRKPIPLQEMPEHLIQAFIAAEDHDFFNHFGLENYQIPKVPKIIWVSALYHVYRFLILGLSDWSAQFIQIRTQIKSTSNKTALVVSIFEKTDNVDRKDQRSRILNSNHQNDLEIAQRLLKPFEVDVSVLPKLKDMLSVSIRF